MTNRFWLIQIEKVVIYISSHSILYLVKESNPLIMLTVWLFLLSVRLTERKCHSCCSVTAVARLHLCHASINIAMSHGWYLFLVNLNNPWSDHSHNSMTITIKLIWGLHVSALNNPLAKKMKSFFFDLQLRISGQLPNDIIQRWSVISDSCFTKATLAFKPSLQEMVSVCVSSKLTTKNRSKLWGKPAGHFLEKSAFSVRSLYQCMAEKT